MHVPEESDSGILPMSHSNKDGKPLAESEEGRLLITEQHSSIWRAPDTERGLRVFHGMGECADKLHAWPLFIRDKSRMR